ncbi:MAG TPA: CcoQ/FixQ family Cbb3-type cytochrome c oxidase assembly chaperone [Ginsengibacter sp.]|nr:CcoQ/FixQ family Cbb3-type cytochrome c oxidase assembly chaperone [Chitinophagaceae bacterium]MCZ2396815.1 CcoQ/FixQ family Cbb3-type cytochrome c oxidase assembly chaperone [Chitinophagales bacterium]HRN72704.1 CcoQ/FixQ family Cbb3-type cytochrome c oxidase assembly chaperone [Ginsengibacter sp.]MCO5286069.1 CcoQ/FixQ family Cbb3-type cytochrome c oxidase assembly chaperone [Chitinophagaceae bacterium]MCW5912980.1 CcoQ/FixQ family Cbb3-type cytochrome c oxidase assembly chaperone [Chitino
MKFINYLKDIHNVQIYPMITLILFVTIFILATILVFSKSKKTINEIKRLPLDD